MIKKGLVQKLEFRGRIVGCLAASTRFLGKMAKPHTMGLAGPLPLHADGVDEPQWVVQYVCGHRQDEKRAGSHGWSHCSNASVNVLADSGAPNTTSVVPLSPDCVTGCTTAMSWIDWKQYLPSAPGGVLVELYRSTAVLGPRHRRQISATLSPTIGYGSARPRA